MRTIGIDIGTTTICGVLYNPETGTTAQTITLPNNSACGGLPFERLQNPKEICATVQSLYASLKAGGDIGAVGVTGQMHGILYLSESGQPLSPLYTWQDQRGSCASQSGPSYAALLQQATGLAAATGFGMVTHFYNCANRLVPENAAWLCTIPDYIAMVLAGAAVPQISPSMAASLGGFCPQTNRFKTDEMAQLGIDCSLLPPLAGAAPMGSKPLVFPAEGDHQASFLASVSQPESEISLNIGTGSQISLYSPVWHASTADIRPFFHHGYLYTGASLNGGSVYKALHDFFAAVLRECGVPACPDIYQRMNQMAESAASPRLLADVSLFGTRGGHTAGSITNITASDFTPEQLVKAFVNGMAAELHQYYQAMPAHIKQGKKALVLSGNAVRQNKALCQSLSASFGMPASLAPCNEEAACGAAIAAAHRAGLRTHPLL